MKILDLTDYSSGTRGSRYIDYRPSSFPDGQQQLTLITYVDPNESVMIKSRMNGFKDVELIACAVASLRANTLNGDIKEHGKKTIHLFVPYFLGARSDRQFMRGENNYLKQVICPIINSLKLDSVTVIDPHSDVLEGCVKNLTRLDNSGLLSFALLDLFPKDHTKLIKGFPVTLVAPDAGALKKIYPLAAKLHVDKVVTCNKVREGGVIVRTEIPEFDFEEKPAIIVDDICDGGRTFIEIAKVLKTRNCNGIYLVVTHGIFSAGFEELSKYFTGIYCTNSVKELTGPAYRDYRVPENFVKQQDVYGSR